MLHSMFGNKIEKLRKKHKAMMTKAFEASRVNRSKSDGYYAEAETLMQQIQKLEKEA